MGTLKSAGLDLMSILWHLTRVCLDKNNASWHYCNVGCYDIAISNRLTRLLEICNGEENCIVSNWFQQHMT